MRRWRYLSVFVLVLTAVYLYALPSATIFYFVNVALHSGLGVLVALGLLDICFEASEKNLSSQVWLVIFGWGGALHWSYCHRHAHRFKMWLYAHIAFCAFAVVLLAAAGCWSAAGWALTTYNARAIRGLLVLGEFEVHAAGLLFDWRVNGLPV